MKKENGQTAMVPLFHSQETISGKVLGFLFLDEFQLVTRI